MPDTARAVPGPAAEPLLRAFLDAVADTLPRSPGGVGPYARLDPAGTTGLALRIEAPADPAAGAFRAVVVLHTAADPTRIADLADVWAGAAPGFGPAARADAVLAVRRAAAAWPPLHALLERAVPDELELDDAELDDLLAGGVAALGGAGVAVHWPRAFAPDLAARVVVGRRGPARFDPAPAEPDAYGLDWELALHGDPLTDGERADLAASRRPVVRLRDGWVLADPATRTRARAGGAGTTTALGALGAALAGVVEVGGERVPVTAEGWLEELRERLAHPAPDVGPPPDLAATLRGYQLEGLRWLVRLTALGLGACLADDMGLGKTVTLIALHLHRRPLAAGPTLVVCPASLLGTWEREIARFAPGAPVHRFHGPGRELAAAGDGFVLTTYATLRRDAPELAARRWGLVVADEAQHVKNAASGTAQALRTVPAAARVALTGTPVENDLSDLRAILDWATPGLLGSAAGFRARWADPIADGDELAAERFARLVRPFLLRRRKSDPGVAPELPPKTVTDHVVALTREQAGLYQAVVAGTMERIRDADGMARRGLIMAMLTALKQICNHPAHYAPEPEPVLAGRSGKLDLLDELLDTVLAGDGAVLVFTQYVALARLLERHLADRGVAAQLLHGGTPVPTREEMVARFQRGDVPVFLLSLRAAGTGLNLTRADHVVHVDRWWNPAVEDQATDRAYRIGQTRPVQVHRIVCAGTVEERIAALLDSKRALAEAVLGVDGPALTELSDADLAALVELREGP